MPVQVDMGHGSVSPTKTNQSTRTRKAGGQEATKEMEGRGITPGQVSHFPYNREPDLHCTVRLVYEANERLQC